MACASPRFWLCRLYLCASVVVVAGLGAFDSTSQHSYALDASGAGGVTASAFLLWFCFLGVTDTIGHDLLGLRSCVFLHIRRFRFMWLMGLAIGLTALILANVRWGYVDMVIIRYALDAAVAIALAASDLRTRR
jgi:hypothetical protein